MEKRPNDVDETLKESFPASDPPSYGSPAIDGPPSTDEEDAGEKSDAKK